MILLLVLLLNLYVNSYNIPIKNYVKNINSYNFKVIEPYYLSEETPIVIFCSGISGYIPYEIYNNFLNELVSQDISCYIYNGKDDETEFLINELSKNNSVNVIGHSSGCSVALSLCNSNENIDNLILFDPVDDRFFKQTNVQRLVSFLEKKKEDIKLNNLKNFFIVNAGKSYKWNYFPFKVPFIPFFKLDTDEIMIDSSDNLNFMSIDIKDYGHSDIVDTIYSNIAHNTIIEGNDDRSEENLNNYQLSLANIINYIININNTLDEFELYKDVIKIDSLKNMKISVNKLK